MPEKDKSTYVTDISYQWNTTSIEPFFSLQMMKATKYIDNNYLPGFDDIEQAIYGLVKADLILDCEASYGEATLHKR